MSLTVFKIRGSDNAQLQIVQSEFPKTINYTDITPVDGSFPAFTTAPIVYVLNATTGRNVFVSAKTTTSFTLDISTSGGGPGTYVIDLAIETEDTPASAPVTAGLRSAPYYCSILDVQNTIINLPQSFSAGRNLDFTKRRIYISQAYGKINAALSKGNYNLPVTLSVQAIVSNTLTAADALVNVDLDSAYNTSSFPVGSTIRINGNLSGMTYGDEFVNVVSISSTTRLVVEFLKNSYTNANTTIELCNDAFLYLRHCNAVGAAYYGLRSLIVGQGQSRNEQVDELKDDFFSCLKDLENGVIDVDGLTKNADDWIKTYQTENPTASDVSGSPVFSLDMKA